MLPLKHAVRAVRHYRLVNGTGPAVLPRWHTVFLPTAAFAFPPALFGFDLVCALAQALLAGLLVVCSSHCIDAFHLLEQAIGLAQSVARTKVSGFRVALAVLTVCVASWVADM